MSSSEQWRQIAWTTAGGVMLRRWKAAPKMGKGRKLYDDLPSAHRERRQLFGRSFHPDRIPTSVMEPELQSDRPN